MRNIDKGMLLAEYFDVDTSKGVSSFIKWIKQSDTFKEFNVVLHQLKENKSLKAKQLYSYARSLNIRNIKSMEEGFVIYGKMNFILSISDSKYFTNPLLVPHLDERKLVLGDIRVNFDERMMSLNDVSLIEGYSFEFKKEYVNSYIENWMNEVNEYLVNPIKKYESTKDFIQERKIFTPLRIIEIVFSVILLFFSFFIRFSNNEFCNKIYLSEFGILTGLSYYLVFSFSIIYFVLIISSIILKTKEFYLYNKNLKKISIDIDSKVVDAKNNLYQYILKRMTSNLPLDASIDSFNELSKLNTPVFYFSKRFYTTKHVKKNNAFLGEIVGTIFMGVLTLCFILILVVSIGGI